MPGPFPGMDPYLEAPAYWHGFHNRLISYASEALNNSMPSGFVADIKERLYVVEAERNVYADIAVLHRPARPEEPESRSAVALALEADPSEIVIAYPPEINEWFIQIRTTRKPLRIVTILEVLSPANKLEGSVGQKEYRQKQREVLQSETHLLEIDLLHIGSHTVAAPLDYLLARGKWDYLACLHRGTERYRYECWLNHLRERLPRVRVPLTDEHPDVILDLQAVFDHAYDAGRYREAVDYREELPIALESEEAKWVDVLLREKGLRD